MKIDELIILMEREGSSMTSTWSEYLCLKRISLNEFELSIRRYAALAESHDYYDEETDDYLLPNEIDGIPVVGVEDNYIIGGDLQFWNDDEAIKYLQLDSTEVRSWLATNRFDYENVANMIKSK